MADPFTSPFCGAVSHNPNDAREKYCGRCHVFVDDEIDRRQLKQVVTRESPCECDPDACYRDCSQRHSCRWQREQIDYWQALEAPGKA